MMHARTNEYDFLVENAKHMEGIEAEEASKTERRSTPWLTRELLHKTRRKWESGKVVVVVVVVIVVVVVV